MIFQSIAGTQEAANDDFGVSRAALDGGLRAGVAATHLSTGPQPALL
ncbi:MAG: hypothetical protein ACLT3D_08470 [Lawsonibacter sp.]